MGHETKAQLKDYVELKIMKIKTTVAALSVLSVLSFGAFAADSIDAAQAQSLPTPLMLHKHKIVKQSGPYP